MPPCSRRSRVNLAFGLTLSLLVQIETARATRTDGDEQRASTTITPSLEGGSRAFDFLIGEWTVVHRRRTQILKGAETSSEFAGVTWETKSVMDLTRKAAASSSQAPGSDALQRVIELRQYTLRPGQRDVLIDLFEREFIEGQEASGMAIIGQFRDLDRPNRFVWIRGFPDMPTRASSLQAFYDGPVWQRHRTTANGTMVDSDNVLLLRPAHSGTGFARPTQPRAPRGATESPPTVVLGVICSFRTAEDPTFVDFFEQRVRPVLEQGGGRTLGSFVTEASPNNFPRLPVREGEHVFVWFSAFASGQALEHLVGGSAWTALEREMTPRLSRAPERLRLAPTARSLLGRER